MTEDELRELVVDISHVETGLHILRAKLKRECHHPRTRLVEKTFGGDWDDPIYVEACAVCVFCGVTLVSNRYQELR